MQNKEPVRGGTELIGLFNRDRSFLRKNTGVVGINRNCCIEHCVICIYLYFLNLLCTEEKC